MKRNRILLISATLAVTAFAFFYLLRERRASAADPLPELVALAPADSQFLAYADIAALRDSPLIQRLTALVPPATTDRDYQSFVAGTGFDYQKDLDRVVIASRKSGSSNETVVFADGRFNHDKIEQYALRTGKLLHENGRSAYVIPSTTPGKTISISFLGSNRVALTDGGDLSAALSPSTAVLDPVMRERLLRVAGTPLFLVAKTPDASTEAQAGATAGGFSASFQSLRWVSLAVRPDGGNLLLSAEGECDGTSQAQSVAAGLELLRGLVGNGLSDPKTRGKMPAATAVALNQMLTSAHVSADASRVRLLLTVTPEMLPSAPSSVQPPGR